MTLILTIFALVFFTELISWIGKSVLLEFVRTVLAFARHDVPYAHTRLSMLYFHDECSSYI